VIEKSNVMFNKTYGFMTVSLYTHNIKYNVPIHKGANSYKIKNSVNEMCYSV